MYSKLPSDVWKITFAFLGTVAYMKFLETQHNSLKPILLPKSLGTLNPHEPYTLNPKALNPKTLNLLPSNPSAPKL